jgi:hypothetical protein
MKKGSNYIKSNGSQFWIFLISCFLLLSARGQAIETSTGVDFVMSTDAAALASARLISDHNIFHFPFHSVPMSSEENTNGQRQTNDNSDNDAKLFEGLLLKERFDFTSGKCLLLRLSHSCENRNDVSLFILHHSWKSFPCF